MKKYLFPVVALVATMASCTSDVEDAVNVNENKSHEYALSLKPFEFEDATRVILEETGSGINFKWDFSEVFGVFPINPENGQVRWELTKEDDCPDEDHYALFRGAGWLLEEDNIYAAYHPYNGDAPNNTPYTAVPVSLPSAQGGTLSAIAPYDYIWAINQNHILAECIQEGKPKNSIVFDFSHAIAIVQIQVPANIVDGIYVTADEGNPFITSGTMNAATGVVTAGASTNRISLSDPETVKNGVATFYMAVFPTETGACTIHVGGLSFQVASKTLKAGKAYRWICQ